MSVKYNIASRTSSGICDRKSDVYELTFVWPGTYEPNSVVLLKLCIVSDSRENIVGLCNTLKYKWGVWWNEWKSKDDGKNFMVFMNFNLTGAKQEKNIGL